VQLVSPPFTTAAVASMVVLGLAACSPSASVSTTGPALQTYSCCVPGDITAVRHPGETVTLHWIATPRGPSTQMSVSTVRLEAGISGPFATVSALKASTSPPTVTAPVIVTTDRVGGAPVSVIQIPKNARAGFYNLTTTVDEDGGRRSGGSVIRVARE
jgi:hypothetical protein